MEDLAVATSAGRDPCADDSSVSGPFKKPLEIIEQEDNAVNSVIEQRVQNGSTRLASLSSRRLEWIKNHVALSFIFEHQLEL